MIWRSLKPYTIKGNTVDRTIAFGVLAAKNLTSIVGQALRSVRNAASYMVTGTKSRKGKTIGQK